MKKNKSIIYVIILVLTQCLSYFLSKISPLKPVLLSSSLDDKIPFIPIFVLFYVFWYLLLVFVPMMLYKKDNEKFKIYFVSVLICLFLSALTFIFYPTMINRPSFKVTNLSTFILNIVYFFDTPAVNCMPSVHCLICFMFLYVSFRNKNIKFSLRLLLEIMSIIVILSTLFIKQHVLIDVFTAFILSFVVYMLVKSLKIYKLIFKNKENN